MKSRANYELTLEIYGRYTKHVREIHSILLKGIFIDLKENEKVKEV